MYIWNEICHNEYWGLTWCNQLKLVVCHISWSFIKFLLKNQDITCYFLRNPVKCTEIEDNDKEALNQLKVPGWPIIFFRSFTQCLFINKNCSLPVVQDETKFSSNSSVTTLKSNKGFLPNLHSLSRDLLSTLRVVTPRVVCSWHTAWDRLLHHSSGVLCAVTSLCFRLTWLRACHTSAVCLAVF